MILTPEVHRQANQLLLMIEANALPEHIAVQAVDGRFRKRYGPVPGVRVVVRVAA